MQTKKNMEIYKQNMKKRISYINKIISGHIYSHTIKITNFLQQTLPCSYIPYIELKLITVVKKF